MGDIPSIDKNQLRLRTGRQGVPPDFENAVGGGHIKVAFVPHPTRGEDRVELSRDALKLLEVARARNGGTASHR